MNSKIKNDPGKTALIKRPGTGATSLKELTKKKKPDPDPQPVKKPIFEDAEETVYDSLLDTGKYPPITPDQVPVFVSFLSGRYSRNVLNQSRADEYKALFKHKTRKAIRTGDITAREYLGHLRTIMDQNAQTLGNLQVLVENAIERRMRIRNRILDALTSVEFSLKKLSWKTITARFATLGVSMLAATSGFVNLLSNVVGEYSTLAAAGIFLATFIFSEAILKGITTTWKNMVERTFIRHERNLMTCPTPKKISSWQRFKTRFSSSKLEEPPTRVEVLMSSVRAAMEKVRGFYPVFYAEIIADENGNPKYSYLEQIRGILEINGNWLPLSKESKSETSASEKPISGSSKNETGSAPDR
ncbi:hypothetical protein KAW38_04610 [Candidatus Micrarchaeota archaeon]|nr:hypothetical protein [Candidatus Micrarchaeota archaeon]